MSDLKTNLGAILATDFSEGDFGVKKNLAIGALAASAALNPMKANASVPVRSDGMVYISEDNPYPIGLFDKTTGKRVTDPQEAYEATKRFPYYDSYAVSVPLHSDSPFDVTPKQAIKMNERARDNALKQTELDEKNRRRFGDDNPDVYGYRSMGERARSSNKSNPRYIHKALVDGEWVDTDDISGHPKNTDDNWYPTGSHSFSERDFGVKKNLAIGALAASAALNPMKANASLPIRSDGMFYVSEDYPYPTGLFDKKTGKRVKDPKIVYNATKDYQYYTNSGAYAPSISGKDLQEITEYKRDRAMKQAELDEKNKLLYGDGKDVIHNNTYEGGGGLGHKYFYVSEFSEQVDLLSGKARKANVKKEAQDLESLKRRIDLIPDPTVRDALNKDWESLNKDRVSRAWVRIPSKVGVASSLASVPATVATMAVAPAVALPLAAVQGAGLALMANQVRVANRAALRPAIDQLEEKVRKAEQDTIYARMMANPASAQLPAKA